MKQRTTINGHEIIQPIKFNESGVGDTIMAKNGLYKDGSTVKLGGVLTENTTIDTTTKKLIIDGGNFSYRVNCIFHNPSNNDIPYRLTKEQSGATINNFGTGFSNVRVLLPSELKDGLEYWFVCDNQGMTIGWEGDSQQRIWDVDLGFRNYLHAKSAGTCHIRWVSGYQGYWTVLYRRGNNWEMKDSW